MMNIDQQRMQQVAQEAFNKVSGNRQWERAIARARVEIEENPFMSVQGDALLILSESNEIYSANGSCQCKAYANGRPCWHRAAARLVKRYMEAAH